MTKRVKIISIATALILVGGGVAGGVYWYVQRSGSSTNKTISAQTKKSIGDAKCNDAELADVIATSDSHANDPDKTLYIENLKLVGACYLYRKDYDNTAQWYKKTADVLRTQGKKEEADKLDVLAAKVIPPKLENSGASIDGDPSHTQLGETSAVQ